MKASFLFRAEDKGAHTHVSVWAGELDRTCGLTGTLVMAPEEWEALRRHLVPECWQCECSLLPTTEPPHCFDCSADFEGDPRELVAKIEIQRAP